MATPFGTLPTFDFSFQKTQSDCEKAGGVWKSMYNWNSGEYVHSTTGKAQFVSSSYRNTYQWNNTLDFLALQQLYFSFGEAQVTISFIMIYYRHE